LASAERAVIGESAMGVDYKVGMHGKT